MEVPLHIYCWRNVRNLDKAKVGVAVEQLKNMLSQMPVLGVVDLRNRIEENRESWLSGRADAPCWFCDSTGSLQVLTAAAKGLLKDTSRITSYDKLEADPANLETVICPECKGTKRAHEMGMHFGWGMAVRNYLRKQGANEAFLGIDNLDDYYVPLIELACGFSAPEGV